MAGLPIVPPEEYQWVRRTRDPRPGSPGSCTGFRSARDRGNGGRIKLAGEPMNPLAERLVNGMESLIELARLKELKGNPDAIMPDNPRDAVLRYFGFPKMDAHRAARR